MNPPDTNAAPTPATAPGGLLAIGTRVKIDQNLEENDGRYARSWTGTITDVGTSPAPFIALTDVWSSVGVNGGATTDTLIFVGPGYAVRASTMP